MKGQMESMGLVLIVVLIVFLSLFALVFLNKTEVKPSSALSVKADNLMNAVTKVNIQGKSFQEGVVECCDGNCDAFSAEVKKILDSSLEENYLFSINKGNRICKELGNCREGIASSEYRLKEYGEQYEIRALLC